MSDDLDDITRAERKWLIDGADLLGEPDPGPTPWLLEGLVVDQAITAVVGRWKTTKSWAMLEQAVSIATGTPAFGTVHVPDPGPVVYVIEESGIRALWRRLDAICRGRAIRPDELRGRLLLSANERVKLDDGEWQARLIETGQKIRPRAFMFDPLARMKASARNESDQTDMAPVIEFLRILRDETDAAPMFVHHTGHQGDHMRGSSDLESAWESRLTFKRDGESGAVTVKSEHRDEDDGPTIVYRLAWDGDTRTMRLRQAHPPLAERIIEHLAEHGPMGAADLAKGVDTRRTDVDRELQRLAEAGTTRRGPSGKLDALGRPATNKVWHLSKQAVLLDTAGRPKPRTTRDDPPDTGVREAGSSPPYKGDVPDDPPDGPPSAGTNGYLEHLFAAFENNHTTEGEWRQGEQLHRRLENTQHEQATTAAATGRIVERYDDRNTP